MTREEKKRELTNLFLSNMMGLGQIIDAAYNIADSIPNWISVENELPPPHYQGANSTDFVLAYDGYDVMFAYYDFGQKNWHGEDYKEVMFDVTHWMQIPMPPQGKEE